MTGARPGDRVEVWFSARTAGPSGTAGATGPGRSDRGGRGRDRTVESEHFTYTVASDAAVGARGGDVLIVASEDYRGVSPTYPAGTTGPQYVDAATGGGIGVFVDDTELTVDGQVVADQSDGFEATAGGPTGRWQVEGPPAGSPTPNQGEFVLSGALVELGAGVATDDTVLLGFGLESVTSPAERADLLGRLLDHLSR